MEHTLSDNVKVIPDITLLNKYVRKAQKVAISAINPVYFTQPDGPPKLHAFSVKVEGPAKHLNYFHRLIDEANLKIS